jgi:hypothetical protein
MGENPELCCSRSFCAVRQKRWPALTVREKPPRHRAASLFGGCRFVLAIGLLQRHKHLNDTFSFFQGFQRFPHHGTKHLASVGSLHGVTAGV